MVQVEEEAIRRFYQSVWNCRNFADMVLIKTLFYTGVRVSELVAIRLGEVDVERCQIRITQGKGSKDRQVPFPLSFSRALFSLRLRWRLPVLVAAYKRGEDADGGKGGAHEERSMETCEERVLEIVHTAGGKALPL